MDNEILMNQYFNEYDLNLAEQVNNNLLYNDIEND